MRSIDVFLCGVLGALACSTTSCSSAVPPRPPGSVVAAPPPKDDGNAAKGAMMRIRQTAPP